MDGLELAACVSELRPDIQVVVTSGHAVVRDTALPARGMFLAKPYRLEDLVQVLASKLRAI
jgi:DNA-binding NtrC family response regulator